MAYAGRILKFLHSISLDIPTSTGVTVLNPYRDKTLFAYCEKFYQKYYSNTDQRTLLVGINPGRFGGGLTGIPFTDPVKLQEQCGIENNLAKRAEISGDFVYKVIHAYGGPKAFYNRFYFSSICPLGFTYEGKNLNYYDLPWLQKAVYPFIVQTIQEQLRFGLNTEMVFCLGMGKNYKFLHTLNQKHRFFKKIVPLPHPRFIMQYRRKNLNAHIQEYLKNIPPAR